MDTSILDCNMQYFIIKLIIIASKSVLSFKTVNMHTLYLAYSLHYDQATPQNTLPTIH